MMSSNGSIFRVTGPLCREFTSHRWIPGTKANDAEFSLTWAWINGWVNNGKAGDLRCHCAHYDVIVMISILNYTNTNRCISISKWNEKRCYYLHVFFNYDHVLSRDCKQYCKHQVNNFDEFYVSFIHKFILKHILRQFYSYIYFKTSLALFV